MDQTETAYLKSKDILKELSTENGFIASAKEVANYRRVWARDGMVMGLAALKTKDPSLIGTFKKTIETLKKYQDETGRIPSNVAPKEGSVSYGTTVGRIDATLWYVIGVCQFFLETEDKPFFSECQESLQKALFYLKCLELNGRGFIYMPQGGDWADEYISHGYVLYDEALYYFALSSYAKCTGDQEVMQKQDYLKTMLYVNFLPKEKHLDNEHVYHKALYERALSEYKPPIPVAYFTTHSIRFHIDVFAISLLLLSESIPAEESEILRNEVLTKARSNNFPILPAFHPVIKEGDHAWQHLESNYLFEFKNQPYEYHNGGLWPLVHGFFLSSFSKGSGEEELKKFADTLARDEYSFPEYYNGQNYESKGIKPIGFSASGYIFAYEAIKNGDSPFSKKKNP